MATSPLAIPATEHAGKSTVLQLLADGEWHTGVTLGQHLGLSRAAIWKQVGALRPLGLRVLTDRRQGYRLDQPLELLTATGIRAGLTPATSAALESLEVLLVTTSTNARLAGRSAPLPGRMHVSVAEYQTGGRGRRGRRWLSPLGHGVCLSVSWCYEVAPRDVSALGLVAGVAVTAALSALGVNEVRLKWPNDVMADGGKLGGILVEVAGESGGPLRVVVGVGLNVRPVPGLASELEAEGGAVRAVALDELRPGDTTGRNRLVGALMNALADSLQSFATGGLATFIGDWRRHDFLLGQRVTVTSGVQTTRGVARGIADDGALLLEVDGRIVPVLAGDVSLRAPP